MLVEVQALAAKAGFGTPQRVATGYDNRRLALVLAVLDKRAELSFAALDVFLNVVGGMRLHEPAGDLAVVAALASSAFDRPVPGDAIFIGEVGLSGEVRPVSADRATPGRSRQDGDDHGLCLRSGHSTPVAGRIANGRRRESARAVRPALPVTRDVGVIIVAAGSGTGPARRKLDQFRWVAGKPMLLHSVQRFQKRADVAMVVCVLPRAFVGDPPPWLFQSDLDRLLISVGGRERQESVANRPAGASCRPSPLSSSTTPPARSVTDATIEAVIERARAGQCAIAALPVVDTLKEVDADGRIVRTVDRDRLWRARHRRPSRARSSTKHMQPRDAIASWPRMTPRSVSGSASPSSSCAAASAQ